MQAFTLTYVAGQRTAKGGLTDAQEAALTEQAQNLYVGLDEHGRSGWLHFQNAILHQMKANDPAPAPGSSRRSRRERKQKGTQSKRSYQIFKKMLDAATNVKDIVGEDAKSIIFGLNSKLASVAWERCQKEGKQDLFTEEKSQSEEATRYIKNSAKETIAEFKKQLKENPNMVKELMEKQGSSSKTRRADKAKRDASPPPKAEKSEPEKKKSSKKPAKSSSSSSDEDESSSESSD